jgi:hypothetical protein
MIYCAHFSHYFNDPSTEAFTAQYTHGIYSIILTLDHVCKCCKIWSSHSEDTEMWYD